MKLYSPEFWILYIALLYIFYLSRLGLRKSIIFWASIGFLASFSFNFLFYALIFTSVNYFLALLIENAQVQRTKRILYKTGLFLDIASLGYYKYLGFILENLHIPFLNNNIPFAFTDLIVPLGISYYTFQGIGYLIQIYRGTEKAEKNFMVFGTYLLFFPKLLAGPIEFSKNLIPQLRNPVQFDYENVRDGLKLILFGMFKKIVIADRLSVWVGSVNENIENYSSLPVLIVFFLQPLHLYFDFSGYTDIALGLAKTFGIKLTNNFHRPFLAQNVTTFWKRWHISLSSWCHEYIFKPIILSKRKWGYWASVYAIFATFFIIGIWHGANWTYIIVGLLQGVAITWEFFTKRRRLQVASHLPVFVVAHLSYFLTYLFFCFTLVFFNSEDVNHALTFLTRLWATDGYIGSSPPNVSFVNKIIIIFGSLFLIINDYLQERYAVNLWQKLDFQPRWVRMSFYWVVFIVVLYFGVNVQSFVYMQF